MQRHLCGASDEAVDLLAPSANVDDEIRDSRVRRDAGSGGAMSDASVTRFDGSSGIDLPDTVVSPESFPGQMFTVSLKVSSQHTSEIHSVNGVVLAHVMQLVALLTGFDVDAARGEGG